MITRLSGTGLYVKARALRGLCILSWILAPGVVAAQSEEAEPIPSDAVILYPIRGEISPRLGKRLKTGVDQLVKRGAKIIIFELDTPGGHLDVATDTAAYIFQLDQRGVETFAFVPNNKRAYSAGALLAFACGHLVMGDNSRIGDVAPVSITLTGDIQELPEKIQTTVRTDLARYADERGYPRALAEAMVSKKMRVFRVKERTAQGPITRYISGQELDSYSPARRSELVQEPELVVSEGQLLTLDEKQAYKFGFVDHIVPSPSHLIEAYGIVGEILNASDLLRGSGAPLIDGVLVRILNHKLTKFVLIVCGILGLVIELQVVGFGIPGTIGLVCFILFFVGGYLGGMVGWVEITLFGTALMLLTAEVFVIPGFGVAGVLGLASLFASLVLAMQPLGAPFSQAGLTQNIMTVVLSLGASIVGIAVLLHYLPKTHLFSRTGLVSTTVLQNSVTPPETDELGYPKSSSLLEKSGTAVTALRPAGKVEIDGQTLDVVTEGEFIDAGMLVEVSYVEGNRIVVRPRV
ncbi:MAG: NfeD family protein [Planctomycetota bacterium]